MGAPADVDHGITRMAAGLVAMSVVLFLTVLARRAVDRYLAPDDPRRFLFAQAILYGGTFLLVVILLLIRRW